MVILVDAGEIENRRNAIAAKVIMIRTATKVIAVFHQVLQAGCHELVVLLHEYEKVQRPVNLSTDELGLVFHFIPGPADHVDVHAGIGAVEGYDRVLGIIE